MKRLVVIAVVAVLAGTIIGCEIPVSVTPQEQVQGFLTAAGVAPQDPAAMKAYFAPETADYGNLQLDSYWAVRFFNATDGPYDILNPVDGGEDPAFPGSVTVTGNVTNAINTDPGYPAVFVLTTDPLNLFADPLIRKITVTVNDTPEVIEKVIP